MRIIVEEYLSTDGTNSYKAWFDSLDAQAAAKIVTAKLRLELGNTSRVKWFGGIGEYVIDWGAGVPNLPRQRRRNTHHFVWWWHQAWTAEGY